nr:hypothetical protein Iba_chr01dCG16180 [Ipomoea batatas]
MGNQVEFGWEWKLEKHNDSVWFRGGYVTVSFGITTAQSGPANGNFLSLLQPRKERTSRSITAVIMDVVQSSPVQRQIKAKEKGRR